MLIQIFNKIYSFIQENKVLKYIYYALVIIYPIIFLGFLKRYGMKAIGFHTNIYIPLFFIFCLEILHSKKFLSNKIFSHSKYILSVYLIIEFVLILIRPEPIYQPYFWGQYFAPYQTYRESYYHNRQPNEDYILSNAEFKFERIANSLGIADYEWSLEKKEGTIRILCLGDSFTEGDGADVDSSYVAFLRRDLQAKYSNIEVMNAGRCGSDPFFDFQLLKDILINYKPDIILQSFTTNDLYYDMLLRGGSERFLDNQKLQYRKNYWWEPIYAASFTARIFIQILGQLDKNLLRTDEYPVIKKEMEAKSVQLFNDYKKYVDDNDIDLIVYSFPFNGKEVDSQENIQFRQKFEDEFQQFGLKFHSLYPCYKKHFEENGQSYDGYFWYKDSHHNAQGYEMMAECLEELTIPLVDSIIANPLPIGNN